MRLSECYNNPNKMILHVYADRRYEVMNSGMFAFAYYYFYFFAFTEA